jgi:intraflagellar transport protein 140
MVANYLQTLDWRNVPTVMKAIVSFYTKARAVESLASFYVSCGQVEIDEYQNYEKGLAAFKEAGRCLGKSKDLGESEMKIRVLKNKMDLIGRFVEARAILKADPTGPWIEICEKLLLDKNIDVSPHTFNILGRS